MKLSKLTLALAIGMTLPCLATAQDNPLPAGFTSQTLLKSGTTRDNEPLAYPGGKPEIISVIGTLEKGGRTALHYHPVPVYVYVLEGEVELRSEGGQPHRYKAGESFLESLNRKHQAFNIADKPSKLLVVFIGEAGKPTTVAAP